MAKKYNVTFANGTEQVVNSKKAVKALEGIIKVTVDGQDITNEFVKEDEVMANNEYVEAIEAIEAVEEAQAEVDAIEAPGDASVPQGGYQARLHRIRML